MLRLSVLFSLDSFAGGFTVQTMIAVWLFLRFDLSIAETGVVFFWTGLLTAGSMLLSPVIAARVGLIRTMVFTHIPANIFLIVDGVDAERDVGDRLSVAEVAARDDGRAGPDVVRDGGGAARAPPGRGRTDERAAQPGVGGWSGTGRCDARSVDVRVAADRRRIVEDLLRPAAPTNVRIDPATRGAGAIARYGATERSLTQLPWKPNGTRWGSGTRAT